MKLEQTIKETLLSEMRESDRELANIVQLNRAYYGLDNALTLFKMVSTQRSLESLRKQGLINKRPNEYEKNIRELLDILRDLIHN